MRGRARPRWSFPLLTVTVLVTLGATVDGATGVVMMLALGALVTGVLVLVTGRRLLSLPGRKGGAVVLAAGTLLLGAGGAMAGPVATDETDAPTAGPSASAGPTAAPVQATPEPASPHVPEPSPDPETAIPESPAEPAPEERPEPEVDPDAGSALAVVDELEVKGRAPRTGYDRDLFGYREHDLDRNGCDVRNDVLRRDLVDLRLQPGTNGCVVESATLSDPYSGRRIDFVRGVGRSNAVQIDHVVALSDAWQKGAQQWSRSTRQQFGNDPLNLLAVDGPLNAQKGAGDTATWLPPNTSFRCQYVARQVAVKHTYALWVTPAERDAMVRVLTTCPGEPLPVDGAAPAPGTATTPERAPAEDPGPAREPAAPAGTDPRFGSCKAAIAEGHGPYVQGTDTEYGWYRDGDSDGTVCER